MELEEEPYSSHAELLVEFERRKRVSHLLHILNKNIEEYKSNECISIYVYKHT